MREPGKPGVWDQAGRGWLCCARHILKCVTCVTFTGKAWRDTEDAQGPGPNVTHIAYIP